MQGEVDDLLKGLYGSSGSKQTLFVESAAQLRLEAAAANGHAAVPSTGPASQPSAGLAARMQPAGGVPSRVGPSAAAPAFEPRMANGQQRRLAPTPLHQPMCNGSIGTRIAPQPVSAAAPVPPTAPQQGQPSQPAPSAALRKPAQAPMPAPAAAGTKRKAAEGAAPPSKRLVAERLDARPSTLQAAAVSPAMAARPVLSLSAPEATVTQQLHSADVSRLEPVGQASGRVLLEAANDLASGLEAASAELMCSCNGKQLWTDRIGGCVARLAGSQNYAAVGLRDGSVQVPGYLPGHLSASQLVSQFHLSSHVGLISYLTLIARETWRLTSSSCQRVYRV